MYEGEKDVLNQLVKARDAVKKKYRQLKFGKDEVEKVLSETFKPITDPLQEIVTTTKKNERNSSVIYNYLNNHKNKYVTKAKTEEPPNDENSTVFESAVSERTNPTKYRLKDYQDQPISGGFYQQELQKTKNPDIYLVEKFF
ncbi:uncharacterized protein LOC111643137 [Copidosoma floridanum]|uniref:uncharacterized protein LOC111643137 n=1 Tax=Copidosoma floridanum TaxID=29053 RepID=UPI000C6F9529|nr:uncharacterized protein LOC111643137 [Copidosoma floridanum]